MLSINYNFFKGFTQWLVPVFQVPEDGNWVPAVKTSIKASKSYFYLKMMASFRKLDFHYILKERDIEIKCFINII